MSASYQKFSGVCSVLVGVAGVLYLVSFIVLKNPAALVPALSLLAVGIFALAPLVALYQLVRAVDEGYALLGLLLSVGGAGGAAIHAAFDIANNLHPPAAPFGYASPVDPRGFLTFAVAGLATIVIAWLIVRGKILPGAVGYIGLLSGVLLVLLYVAYLIILDASNPLVLILVLASGIIQPLWFLWIGWSFLQGNVRVPGRAATRKSR